MIFKHLIKTRLSLALLLAVAGILLLGLWHKEQQEKKITENPVKMRHNLCDLLEDLSTTKDCVTSTPVTCSRTFDFDHIKGHFTNLVLKGWINKGGDGKELIQSQSFSNSNGCEVSIDIYCGAVMYERINSIFGCEYSLVDAVKVNNFPIQEWLYSMQVLSYREDYESNIYLIEDRFYYVTKSKERSDEVWLRVEYDFDKDVSYKEACRFIRETYMLRGRDGVIQKAPIKSGGD